LKSEYFETDKFADAKTFIMKTERKHQTAKKIKHDAKGSIDSSVRHSRNIGRQSIPISCTSKLNALVPSFSIQSSTSIVK
jgi:hypothetical protein